MTCQEHGDREELCALGTLVCEQPDSRLLGRMRVAMACIVLMWAPVAALQASSVRIGPAAQTQYRAAAELCVDSFVRLALGPLSRPLEVNNWEQALRARCGADAFSRNTLLVATDADSKLVGCVECGMLPPPPRSLKAKAAEVGDGSAKEVFAAAAAAAAAAPAPPAPPPPDVPYLANLVVKPTCRRVGLGKQLVVATEECARAWGHAELCIKVDRQNFDARRLYDRMGYELVYVQNRRADVTNKQGAWVFLSKKLDAAEAAPQEAAPAD